MCTGLNSVTVKYCKYWWMWMNVNVVSCRANLLGGTSAFADDPWSDVEDRGGAMSDDRMLTVDQIRQQQQQIIRGLCFHLIMFSTYTTMLRNALSRAVSVALGNHSPLPPVGHIWDVMLVWRKGNINKNCLCVKVLCTIIMVHKDTSSSYRSVDYIELWSSKRLCVFSLNGAI